MIQINPSEKVSSEAAHALLRIGKQTMSKGKFTRTLMHRYAEDVKSGARPKISKASMLQSTKAVARGQHLPGSTQHKIQERNELIKEMGETHLIKGEGETTQKLEFRKYDALVTKHEKDATAQAKKEKESGGPSLSRAEQRKKEARHTIDMLAQARERRAEAEREKTGKVNATTSVGRQGASSAEEAAKESKERGKQDAASKDWRNKPAVDSMLFD